MNKFLSRAFALGRTPMLLCAVLLATNAKAENVVVPDGSYECSTFLSSYVYAGELQVEGNSYRGPSLDGNFPDGWIEFDSDAEGHVFLIGKPFGGYTGDGYTVTMAEAFGTEQGKAAMAIALRGESGEMFSVDCVRKD